MSVRGRHAAAMAGFTLLELLVAITLLGLVFAMLAGGLRLGVAAWEKSGDTAARTATLQTAHRFLRREIEQMRPIPRPALGRDRVLAVSGTPSELVFIGPPPSMAAAPGLYRFRVAVEGPAGKRSLVARWRQLRPDLSDLDDGGAEDGIVLMTGIASGEISYFGWPPRDADPLWQDRWEDRVEMPMLVRIDLRFPPGDTRQWPALVIAPQIRGSR